MLPTTDRKSEKTEQKINKKRVWTTQELFQGGREVIIRHSDNQYRLQITKAGKLILNK